jgi:cytochrome c oxidase assembly protein subunit 11
MGVSRKTNLGLTAAALVVFVAAMVGMSYAAVPLYRVFCAVTGFGGTTRRATVAPEKMSDRIVTVRFDSNIGNGLGWSFRPEVRSVNLKLGEIGTVKFLAHNLTDKTVTGTAAFNVTPPTVGAYFNKLACFCFTDQTLAPHEQSELGVTFFVDPAMAKDDELTNTDTITLSYTFYPAPTPSPVASATGKPAGTGG